jgi:hypothetical protein
LRLLARALHTRLWCRSSNFHDAERALGLEVLPCIRQLLSHQLHLFRRGSDGGRLAPTGLLLCFEELDELNDGAAVQLADAVAVGKEMPERRLGAYCRGCEDCWGVRVVRG